MGIIPEAHLRNHNEARRNNADKRPFPLSEPGQPSRNGGTPPEQASSLASIIEWLDVENSARYRRTPAETYCNIYAYDYGYLAGVYVPRVWWTNDALNRIDAGENVKASYGKTVSELNVNSVVPWFTKFGPMFGWKLASDVDELQSAANDGKVCIVCASHKNSGSHGHICAVVPEGNGHAAVRSNGSVTIPLQSQAGAVNYKYGAKLWWKDGNHNPPNFWIHD